MYSLYSRLLERSSAVMIDLENEVGAIFTYYAKLTVNSGTDKRVGKVSN